MEADSGAKIAIRGKGSVKEGKGKSDAAHASNQDEDLHCLIMADTEEKVNKAKSLIHQVIETVSVLPSPPMLPPADLIKAASIPEGQNELKRHQLRELAALNGTLRDDENQACQNCGEIGHRKYDCPQARNYTAGIICRVCGNAGHMARDCPDRARGQDPRRFQGRGRGNGGEEEFNRLLTDLGGASGTDPARQIAYEASAGPGGQRNEPPPPPGPGNSSSPGAGAAALPPWMQMQNQNGNNRPPPPGPSGGSAPWANDRGGNGWGQGRDNSYGRDNGYGGGNGYGGRGYDAGYAASNGYQQPWAQQGAGGAPWQQGGYGGAPWAAAAAPPPPPPADDHVPPPPPPPQNDFVPPPPPRD
jgi:splicing factor 1